MAKDIVATTPEQKLDVIIMHLEAMDRRDRMRTQAAFFRGLLGLIPLVVFIWSLWYFANNSQQILAEITKQAATAAAEATKNSGEGMLDELMRQYGITGSSSSSSAPRR